MSLRYFAIIGLLCLILFQSVGYYFIYDADLVAVRREAAILIHEAMNPSQAITLSFAARNGKVLANGLVFTDDDEFSWQGHMYDVISMEVRKDQVILKCYPDQKETELTSNLSKKIDAERDAPSQKNKNNLLQKFKFETLTHSVSQIKRAAISSLAVYFPLHQSNYTICVFQAIISPPPEFIIS